MVGLYGKAMHDYVMREIEIGHRAAACEDSEWNAGWSAIDDLTYEQYERERERREGL
jgi:hypothetical protein